MFKIDLGLDKLLKDLNRSLDGTLKGIDKSLGKPIGKVKSINVGKELSNAGNEFDNLFKNIKKAPKDVSDKLASWEDSADDLSDRVGEGLRKLPSDVGKITGKAGSSFLDGLFGGNISQKATVAGAIVLGAYTVPKIITALKSSDESDKPENKKEESSDGSSG